MFIKKKPIPDVDDLERLKKEAQKLQIVEDGLKTPFGKYILELIKIYKEHIKDERLHKDISGMFDRTDWLYSLRGKEQILDDIEKTLSRAKEDKEAIIKELKQYSA